MFEVIADYHDKLDERRMNILNDLVKYRALTTEQIKRKYFGNKGNHVNNILGQMRKRGYVKSETLVGSRTGKKGYTFHKITEGGIDVLYASGAEYEEEIHEPYLRQNQLRYIISANKVFLHLEGNG